MCSIFFISSKEANATSGTLSDQTSCIALKGIWNNNMHSCNFSSLKIDAGDTLTVSNGVTLINSGNLSDSGTLSIFYGGNLINSGKITITNKGVNNYGIFNTGTVTNFGTITISNSNRLGIYNTGIIYELCGAQYFGTLPNGNPIKNISCTSFLVASPDSSRTLKNIPVNIPVLANDSAGTIIQSFTQGTKGTVTGPSPENFITYIPKKNAFGKDSFSYTITDNKKHTASANVVVTIFIDPHCSGGHDLSGCSFVYANLPGGKFGGDNLRNVDFTNANLVGADLGGADLQGAIFKGADLTGINLSGDNLRNENFENADLSYANLTGANLSDANLSGTNLLGANLSGAKLTGANISGSNFQGVNPGCFHCK